MRMTFKNYVCVTCAQDFTRKYSAYRHNRDLHQGRSNIVRTLEYIIGRVTGNYPSADPKTFRKNGTRSPRGNIDNFPFINVAHDRSDSRSFENLRGLEYGMNQNPSEEPVGSSPPRQFADHTTLKLEEIKSLLKNVYPDIDPDILLYKIGIEIIQGKGKLNLDDYLQLLQGIQATSIRTSSKRLEKPPLSLHRDLGDLSPEARDLLVELEEVMSPHEHPAFVFDVIEELAKNYRIVGNLNIIRFPLDFYKRTGRIP